MFSLSTLDSRFTSQNKLYFLIFFIKTIWNQSVSFLTKVIQSVPSEFLVTFKTLKLYNIFFVELGGALSSQVGVQSQFIFFLFCKHFPYLFW